MANKIEDLFWFIIFLAICGGIVVGILGSNWIPFTSEVTVYKVMCSGEIKNGSCEGKKAPLDRITFKASENQQSVVISFDEGYPAFGRMDICIVKDKKNWTCKTGPFSHDSMIRGEYKREPPSLNTYYVPKWKWWILQLSRRLNKAAQE
ncbi:MAG: hypothetical protein V3W33_05865 [Gammaproteobacteria bacterium]